jgi:cation diffusion facilitator family transporter
VIGVELGERSIGKILNPVEVNISTLTLGVLIISVLIKLWMSGFFKKLGTKISSGTLLAAAVDSRNDVITTSAVLVGAVMEKMFQVSVDGYIGLGVAAFILYSGVQVARETVSPLLGQRADQQLVSEISRCILSHEKVLGIHDLLVHDYGPGQCFASVHVELSASEDPLTCHDMIDAIECDVLENLNVHLVIHYDPVLNDDAEWAQLRRLTEEIVAGIDPVLSVHDFRIVRGADQPKLVFDLAVPYDVALDHKQFRQQFEDALQAKGKVYLAVIRFDMT